MTDKELLHAVASAMVTLQASLQTVRMDRSRGADIRDFFDKLPQYPAVRLRNIANKYCKD